MESESGVVMALAGPVLFGLAVVLRMSREWRGYSAIRRSLAETAIQTAHRQIENRQWHPADSKEPEIGSSASY
jgi:hypothetical protein